MASKTRQPPLLHQNNIEATPLDERIVISGMAGLFPSCNHVKDLNNILYNKIYPISNSRWNYQHPEVAKFTGNVPDLQRFDAQFFGVHYQQCNNMDSMVRKVLEQAYAAVYDAGINPRQLFGKKVGVYIGSTFSETDKVYYFDYSKTGFGIVGCNKAMLANRISYWLNIKGSSMTIDNACCSSMEALKLAYQAIMRGECEAAIVGGTNICLHPQTSVQYGRIIKLSKDGKTRSFDKNAGGCVRSEGICVLFLQKAKDAFRVYADVVHVKTEFTSMVKGETGPKYGFERYPSDLVKFLKSFYEEAKVDPQAVQYVEAFGSAIPEADKVELDVIDEVFCEKRKNKLLLGSVTSNIGYADAASGINSIIKVLLGYHNSKLAANMHCDSPRQDVAALREGRMQIVTEHENFEHSYTAINGFSLAGSNGHILLNSRYKPKDMARYNSTIPHLVLISARTDAAVKTILDNLKSKPIDPEELALLNNIHETKVSGQLGRGFTILDKSTDNKTVSLFEVFHYFDEAQRPLWFVYSGMGSQWARMGTDLMRMPIFAAAIERCHKVLEPKGIDIVNIITSSDERTFDNILNSFVGIAAIQIGLTDLLRELGIYPDKIIGHSVGELGCAYADGCFTAEEMILSAYSRGLVSVEAQLIRGSMAAVGLGFEEISKLCPPEIDVACHNSPDSSTISGPADIMTNFVASLIKQGVFAKEVPCSNIAYHSRYIAEIGPRLLNYLKKVITSPKPRSDRWVSTSVPQERWNESLAKYSSAEYHTNNLLNPVLFDEVSKLIPPNAVVVEIAPHGLLQAILKRSLPQTCRNIALTRRGHPNNVCFFLEAVGGLFMEGYMPKVKALYPKIEFPVSTGTPMLSDLVQWSHQEQWSVPLYRTVNKKFASTCKYLISTHDDEHNYLRGHIIRGQNQYPFAATLVNVWDTLAMSLGTELKNLSVQFCDVHLLSQPILHDQRPLRLNVTIQRCSGRFEVMDGIILIARGYIFGKVLPTESKSYSLNNESEPLFYIDEIYQWFSSRDYDYEGVFRSIYSASIKHTGAEIIWQNNWVSLIDAMIQINSMKLTHQSVSQPNYIRKLSIDVKKHELAETYKINDFVIMKAETSNLYEYTSCGGITMEQIAFLEMPPVAEKLLFKSLQLMPVLQSDTCKKDFSDGDYILSLEEDTNINAGILLKNGRTADVDSLHWVRAPEPTGTGLTVKVHYVGVNTVSANRHLGIYKVNKNPNQTNMEIDFSGTLQSGVRVMGITQTEGVTSSLKANPNLLWPVPVNWSLEDAATVPLAYSMAFYILCIKTTLMPGQRIFVHGGAGALGQAIISIAIAHGCEVFTTVSNLKKKHFLKRLFPELKVDHIGYSRDVSFCDMVSTITKGNCCDIVIMCSKKELKNSSMKCSGIIGITVDTDLLLTSEDYQFGMHNLTLDRSYVPIHLSTLFKPEYAAEMKQIQHLVSDGIARGYVRPITRLVLKPQDVRRAFRLILNNRQRGRVLLDFHQTGLHVHPSFLCTPQSCHVLVSDNYIFGIKMAEKMISLGAKMLILHLPEPSNFVSFKSRLWHEQGISVKIFYSNISDESIIADIMKLGQSYGSIESILVTVTKAANDIKKALQIYSSIIQNLGISPKYFALVQSMYTSKDISTMSMKKGQRYIHIKLPPIHKINEIDGIQSISINCALDALLKAINMNRSVVVNQKEITAQPTSLLQELAAIAEIKLPSVTQFNNTLTQLEMDISKIATVNALLHAYNISVPEDRIPSLTLHEIADLEKRLLNKQFKDTNGLKTFYSHIDSDEILTATEMVFLPTLTNSSTMHDDEFDASDTYLCILPGLEGLYSRFQELCERLKLHALVLQPGFDNPNETIRELAQRFANTLLTKTDLKNKFYLLGYECGVLVALEMAAILEEHGLTGTVYLLGGSPDVIKTALEDKLSEFETDTALQVAVAKHMYSLMANDDSEQLDNAIKNVNTWNERVKISVQAVIGQLPCSYQYATAVIQAAYLRILQVRQYKSQPRKLRSLLVSLIPRYSFDTKQLSLTLNQFSQQPVIFYQLEAPLAFAAQDLRCTALINRHLDSDLIDSYNKRNHCDCYVMNDNMFTSMK